MTSSVVEDAASWSMAQGIRVSLVASRSLIVAPLLTSGLGGLGAYVIC